MNDQKYYFSFIQNLKIKVYLEIRAGNVLTYDNIYHIPRYFFLVET